MPILLFYVTHPDEATAREIAARLFEKKLVACANFFPIGSMYEWQGAKQNDKEWVSVLKTRPELESRVEEALAALHPYDTPCFIRWEVRANEGYERWIDEQTAVSS
ncbi:MAG: divalent-cation tolerance protein CutA [Saprospiraceae bacterium]|nr:divalent-cation tolerance protein CutA [Saprospiraceae bacterium]